MHGDDGMMVGVEAGAWRDALLACACVMTPSVWYSAAVSCVDVEPSSQRGREGPLASPCESPGVFTS